MAYLNKLLKDIFCILLFGLFMILFLFAEEIKNISFFNRIPSSFLNINTIFLSIILEAIPFILLGVFVSAIIQTFVSENAIRKVLPRNPYLAVIPAALLGIIFPICECAIVPVVRRLIKKGMPSHVGVVFMLSAPILNPVVYASTYFAFKSTPYIANARMVVGFISSIIIGLIIYRRFKGENILKTVKDGPHDDHHHHHKKVNKLLETLYHASDELFDTGKYLFIGAFLASLFQTFLDRNVLLSIGTSTHIAPVVMMGFGYVLSVCSSADAFVASSFGSTFTEGSILAFLVFGPMIDIKNTLMLFGYFKKRFVLFILIVTPVVVYLSVYIFQLFFI
ncbi:MULTISPECIES: permease [unclassified Bacillus (in: firmicutes)]|uniref:permease n=1 Tax=unclassified Bacillus (in: firmicutes) TaxID=185979 RepID=UPI001BEB93C0|nr:MULTISPECIES: permease [unclassified Bacillus (in: firmicutes)]MBT2725123.1 permease [Bacillus sp. ISL-46]MBT2744426.1 permease [Bacillus sp. ISL-77]